MFLPCEWLMSHIWMSRLTHVNVSRHVFAVCTLEPSRNPWCSCPTNESCHTFEWVTSHISMRHVTHVNESRHTFAVSALEPSRNSGCFCPMNKLHHICKWVTSHIWMSRVTGINESRHTFAESTLEPSRNPGCSWPMIELRYPYEWVTSHMWMSHVTRMNESHHTLAVSTLEPSRNPGCSCPLHRHCRNLPCRWVHTCVPHLHTLQHTLCSVLSSLFKTPTGLFWDKECVCVCVCLRVSICVCVWGRKREKRESIRYLAHVFHTTYSYACHDLFIWMAWLMRVTWLLQTDACDMPHAYVCHDVCVWHDSYTDQVGGWHAGVCVAGVVYSVCVCVCVCVRERERERTHVSMCDT